MPHVYECRQCDVVSPQRRDDRQDAEDDRDEHRGAAHGGLAPSMGDCINRVHTTSRGDGVLPAGWQWAALFMLALMAWNWWGH